MQINPLCAGDVIVELDGRDVRSIGHKQLVDLLRDCPQGYRGRLIVRRSSPKQRYGRMEGVSVDTEGYGSTRTILLNSA